MSPHYVDRLFHRSLVVCNFYPEFWSRYVDWLIEIRADFTSARSVLLKGRTIFIPSSTPLWIKSAEIEESNNDDEARSILIEIDRLKKWADPEVILHRVAFERRHQNIVACRKIFQSSIHRGAEKVNEDINNEDVNNEEPVRRSELSAIAKVKVAIACAYFLMETDGDVITAR